ncbi:hypothetical protein BO225_01210 [Dubosiella newyorkensis]|uniref:Transposase TnpC homeodomain domain-containing protein n=1 Tax=Dubosiella newyorkensis TaxID=1862672 RepID=A0A1U7NQA2_9FIRM|nr:hypothetical protein BO225_01210 [Dubosiella newyorkensis]
MEKEKQTTVEVDKEQLEKMIKAIEDLTVRIEELNKTIKHKDAIIEKLQRMLFGKKSEKARHAEMMANMPTLFDLEYPEHSVFQKKTLLEQRRSGRCRKNQDRDRSCRGRKEVPMVRQRNGEDRRRKGEDAGNHRRAENPYRRDLYRNVRLSLLQTGWRRRAFQNRSPSSRYSAFFCERGSDRSCSQRAFCQKRTLQPAGEGVEMAGSLHQPENDVQLDHGGLRTLS